MKRAKMKKMFNKHIKIFGVVGIALLSILFYLFFKGAYNDSRGDYIYIFFLLLSVFAVVLYAIKTYVKIIIPFVKSHMIKYARGISFFFLILPLWLSSLYCVFSSHINDVFMPENPNCLLIFQVIGGIGIVFSLVVTHFWIKTDFSDGIGTKEVKNREIEEVELSKSIVHYLKGGEVLWANILNSDHNNCLDKDGKILADEKLPYIDMPKTGGKERRRQLTKKEVAATLCRKLYDMELFKDEYNKWKFIIKISKSQFGVATTYTKDKGLCVNGLFDWINLDFLDYSNHSIESKIK